eukprot:gnl/Dysnectes_brevis/2390_a2832_1813.p1 GENE.gnl/Dysnectes_brevis/2390_a2832_1813~~gnl/Dysnectes_brevis/2390_a2832_1813.p1  ORF type:complete len:181 (+),score=14.45 gnl/Dysnectes_brevis/2390_a2832_1813:140-682(+)
MHSHIHSKSLLSQIHRIDDTDHSETDESSVVELNSHDLHHQLIDTIQYPFSLFESKYEIDYSQSLTPRTSSSMEVVHNHYIDLCVGISKQDGTPMSCVVVQLYSDHPELKRKIIQQVNQCTKIQRDHPDTTCQYQHFHDPVGDRLILVSEAVPMLVYTHAAIACSTRSRHPSRPPMRMRG